MYVKYEEKSLAIVMVNNFATIQQNEHLHLTWNHWTQITRHICNICKVSHWIWDIGDKPEHNPLNNNNYIYIFRNIKTLNYVLFLLCVCLIYQSWMFVLLMMPHVGLWLGNKIYSILFIQMKIQVLIWDRHKNVARLNRVMQFVN